MQEEFNWLDAMYKGVAEHRKKKNKLIDAALNATNVKDYEEAVADLAEEIYRDKGFDDENSHNNER